MSRLDAIYLAKSNTELLARFSVAVRAAIAAGVEQEAAKDADKRDAARVEWLRRAVVEKRAQFLANIVMEHALIRNSALLTGRDGVTDEDIEALVAEHLPKFISLGV